MCTSPLLIKNNRSDFNSNRHKVLLAVPCGKCDECRIHLVNQMATRLSFETYANYKRKGKTLFLTFTYNNYCIPTAIYNGETFQCFNHEDVLALLRRLHKYYRKRGIKFKHFACSEYGSVTKRPHYHILFWLPPEIDDKQFARMARHYWTGFDVNRGFMFPSHRDCETYNKHLIRSFSGVSTYASKYACKDLAFYKLPIIQTIMGDKELRQKYKNCLPRNYVSANVGISILPNLKPDTEELINPCSGQPCSIPQYAWNKLCYRFYRDGRINARGQKMISRELTDFGKSYYAKVFRKCILHKADVYRTLIEDSQLQDQIFSDPLQMSIWHYMYQNRSTRFFKDIQDLQGFDPFNLDQVCSLHEAFDIERCDTKYLYFERKVTNDWSQVYPPTISVEARTDSDMRKDDYAFGPAEYMDIDFNLEYDTAILDNLIQKLAAAKAHERVTIMEQARALKQKEKPH